jgi:hypothetical protein
MTAFLLTLCMAQVPLEQRVEKLEKSMTDAGRALLFRNEGFANPPKVIPMTYPKAMPSAVMLKAIPVHGVVSASVTKTTVKSTLGDGPIRRTVRWFAMPWAR